VTIGVVLAVYFGIDGVESLRVGLIALTAWSEHGAVLAAVWNRSAHAIAAYLAGARHFYVLAPFLLSTARHYMPLLEPTDVYLTFPRYGVPTLAHHRVFIVTNGFRSDRRLVIFCPHHRYLSASRCRELCSVNYSNISQ